MPKRFLKALKHSVRGIAVAVIEERNLKIHVFVSIAVIALSFYFKITTIEWCFILFSIALVICAELFNTALEKICDLVQPDLDHRIRDIKDISAGAVLFCSIISCIIGLCVFIPYINIRVF